MKQRIITGFVLALIFIPLLFLPAFWFSLVVGAMAIIASAEFFFMVQKKENISHGLVVFSILFTLALYTTSRIMFDDITLAPWIMLVLVIEMVVVLSLLVLKQTMNVDVMSKLFFGTLYVALPFATLAYIQSLGLMILLYLLIIVMFTDSFALFVGLRFGKRKLAPVLSPKKSVEGALGGLFFAVLFATVYAVVFNIFDIELTVLNVLLHVLLGVIISIIAQMGDLIASSFKRSHGIKDFSPIFPGHGGVLDRFDSTLFASMVLGVVIMAMERLL